MENRRVLFKKYLSIQISVFIAKMQANAKDVKRLEEDGWNTTSIPDYLKEDSPLYLFRPRFDVLQKDEFVRALKCFIDEPIDETVIGISSNANGWVYGNYSFNILEQYMFYNYHSPIIDSYCSLRFKSDSLYMTNKIIRFSFYIKIETDVKTNEFYSLSLTEKCREDKEAKENEKETVNVSYNKDLLKSLSYEKLMSNAYKTVRNKNF